MKKIGVVCSGVISAAQFISCDRYEKKKKPDFKIQNNDYCNCGSGLKYKKCCKFKA